MAATVFLVYRTLADGIRLHTAALVVAVVVGAPEPYFILVLAAAMVFYTEEGGVKATIWTDVVQMFVYLAGALAVLVAVAHALPGGISESVASAAQAGKTQFLDLSLDSGKTYTLWSGVIGGMFLTLATHGTDQYLVQRLLAARSAREAGRGLVLSGFVVFGQFALFLLIGALLWSFYGGKSFVRGDEVLPTFIANELPGAWTGFILAAVVAAALSPSLNSLASTTLKDFYIPYLNPGAGEAQQIRLGRMFTVFWGWRKRLSPCWRNGLRLHSRPDSRLCPTRRVPRWVLSCSASRAVGLPRQGPLVGMLAGFIAPTLIGLLTPLAWTWNVAVGGHYDVFRGLPVLTN